MVQLIKYAAIASLAAMTISATTVVQDRYASQPIEQKSSWYDLGSYFRRACARFAPAPLEEYAGKSWSDVENYWFGRDGSDIEESVADAPVSAFPAPENKLMWDGARSQPDEQSRREVAALADFVQNANANKRVVDFDQFNNEKGAAFVASSFYVDYRANAENVEGQSPAPSKNCRFVHALDKKEFFQQMTDFEYYDSSEVRGVVVVPGQLEIFERPSQCSSYFCGVATFQRNLAFKVSRPNAEEEASTFVRNVDVKSGCAQVGTYHSNRFITRVVIDKHTDRHVSGKIVVISYNEHFALHAYRLSHVPQDSCASVTPFSFSL